MVYAELSSHHIHTREAYFAKKHLPLVDTALLLGWGVVVHSDQKDECRGELGKERGFGNSFAPTILSPSHRETRHSGPCLGDSTSASYLPQWRKGEHVIAGYHIFAFFVWMLESVEGRREARQASWTSFHARCGSTDRTGDDKHLCIFMYNVSFFSRLLFVCSICLHPSSVVWSEVIVAEKLRHLLFSKTPLSCGQTFTIPDVGIFCLKPNTFLMILVSCLSWSDAIKVLLLNIFLHGKPCQFTRFLIEQFSKSKIFTN